MNEDESSEEGNVNEVKSINEDVGYREGCMN